MVLVSLTGPGRHLEGPVTAIWRQLEEQTVNGLTSSEQDQLRILLLRVATSITSAVTND
ncbi:hypothetical protein [Cryobacterium sp. AP23]